MWTLDLIRELADETGDVLGSIYFPTHRSGPDTQQDPIRLKNAIKALEAERERKELDAEKVEALLAHPRRLIEDEEFWRHQSLGLALFCRPSGMRIMKLPFAPAEFSRLGERFHIAPLVRAAGDLPVFHMLALNRDGSALYDVAGEDVVERTLDPRLESLAAARGMSDYDADAGFHSDSRGSRRGEGGEATPRYHALGTGTDEQEEVELERYLASIAHAVGEALAGSQAPLVLAGGDRLCGHIRGMLKGPRLCEGFVARNVNGVEPETLASAAREIVLAETGSPRDEAMERLEARLGSGEETALKDPDKLKQAASEGRVDVAFLDLQEKPEGTPADRDRARLIDDIAVETIRHGGTVYAMPAAAAEKLAPAAALLRY